MALVCVHGPLRKLAGGTAELQIGGATVEELLRGLSTSTLPSPAGSSTSAGSFAATSTYSSTASAVGRRQLSDPATASRSCPRLQEERNYDRADRRYQEGFVRPRGQPGWRVQGALPGVPGRAHRLRAARPRQRAPDRHVDVAVLRSEDLVCRRPGRRVDAGRRSRAPRRRRGGARAHLGDRPRRGRLALGRRRPGRVVREPRRRTDLGAQRRAAPAPGRRGLAAGGRRAVSALDRSLARRAGSVVGGRLGRRRLAHRGPWPDLAQGQPGHQPAVPARGGS